MSKLTAKELSETLFTDLDVIKKYIKQGMPLDGDLGVVVAWIAENITHEKKVAKKKKVAEKKAVKKKKPVVQVVEPSLDGDQLPDGEMSVEEARRRKEVANALQAELNLAKDREQVANIDDLMELFSEALVNVRASLTSLSSRMSGMLAHQDEESVRKLIDKEIQDTLENLSSYD